MLKITRPIKTNWISQTYSESKACISKYTGKITGKKDGICPQGSTSFYEYIGLLYHNGLDLVAYFKERVFHCANFDGWLRTEMDSAGGIGVDIVSHEPTLKCTEPNCEETHYIKMRYWHNTHITWWGAILLVTYAVKRYFDIKVKMGDNIALAGSTGASSSTHVHLGVKWCDKDGNGLHTNNGTYGAFDPTPYFENIFVHDYIKREKILIESQIVVTQITLLERLYALITQLKIQILKAKKSVGSFIGNL